MLTILKSIFRRTAFNHLDQQININSSRTYLAGFIQAAAKSLPKEALVLDAGAGDGQYAVFFPHAKYESADFCQLEKHYAEVTYVCDLTNIPVEDNRYDMVLCTQVLEHMSEPKALLKELHRILKPNAELWLSAPLFYEEHEIPYDYYRYTQFGFKHLLQSAGFNLKKLEWLEGYYGTLSYQLKTASTELPLDAKYYGGGLLGLAVIPVIFLGKKMFALLSVLFAYLDIKHKNISIGYCKNYAVIATK